MKKIFKIMIIFALICAMLCIPALAIDTENTENPAETPEILPPADESTTEGVTDGVETETSEETEKFYSGWIDKITDATMWVNVLATLSGMLAVIGIVRNKLGAVGNNIGTLLKGQISKTTLQELIKDQMESALTLYEKEMAEMRARLEEQTSKEDKLLSMFAIFMANAKINPYARAEIMGIISGAKNKITTLEETVAAANDAIAAAMAAEEKVETPSLDAICNTDGAAVLPVASSPSTSHIALG